MTAPGGRPIVHTHKKRGMLSPPPPKPCPRCYEPMREVRKGVWECPKHGEAKSA